MVLKGEPLQLQLLYCGVVPGQRFRVSYIQKEGGGGTARTQTGKWKQEANGRAEERRGSVVGKAVLHGGLGV